MRRFRIDDEVGLIGGRPYPLGDGVIVDIKAFQVLVVEYGGTDMQRSTWYHISNLVDADTLRKDRSQLAEDEALMWGRLT